MYKFIKAFLYGMIFGFATPIPGVSSGTVAMFLNIYEKIFRSLNIAFVKRNILRFILFLSGWFVAVYVFSNILTLLLKNYAFIVSYCFLGFILGCIPNIYRKARQDKLKLVYYLIFLCALGFMLFVDSKVGDLTSSSGIKQSVVLSPALFGYLFFCCIFSSAAMLVPGVGGSLMMLILGIYTIYFEAFATLNLPILLVCGSGVIFGIPTGYYIIKKILKSIPQAFYCTILGLITGSLFIIFPGFSLDFVGLLAILFALLCAVFTYKLS